MDVKACIVGDMSLVVASMSEGRIVAADFNRQHLVADVSLPEDCGSAFDVSPSGGRIATGYWYEKGVDVWESPSGRHLCKFGPSHVSRLRFNATGQHVVVRAEKASFVQSIELAVSEALMNCGDLDGATLDTRGDRMFVPSTRRDTVWRLGFEPLNVDRLALVAGTTIDALVWHSNADALVMLANRGRLTCLTYPGLEVLWRSDYPAQLSEPALCGDESLIAASDRSATQTVVLDAETGHVVRSIQGAFGPYYAVDAKRMMTFNGLVLDLETRTISDGVSRPSWWRCAGA